jgi:hypothetical protein
MSRYNGYRKRWKKLLRDHETNELSNPIELMRKSYDTGIALKNPKLIALFNNLRESIEEMLKATGGDNGLPPLVCNEYYNKPLSKPIVQEIVKPLPKAGTIVPGTPYRGFR